MTAKRNAKDVSERADVLSLVLMAWQRNPALRLGQLIAFAVARAEGKDLFYLPDFELIEWLEKLNAETAPS